MRFCLLFLGGWLALSGTAVAGSVPHFPTGTIPAALRENAHAVVRLYDQTFTVKSTGQAVNTLHYAVTVLDEEGDEYATDVVSYDRFKSVNYLRGTVYDAEGRQLRSLRPAEVRDVSLTPD